MFFTEKIQLPYALLALIHYHVISSVVCLFMIFQVFYINNRAKHEAFGTFFAITTYQACLSGIASIIFLHFYFWLNGIELNEAMFTLSLSASYGFAALHCITLAISVRKTENTPTSAKYFLYAFLVSSPVLIVMLVSLKWYSMVLYTTLNFGVNAFCLTRVFKHAKQPDPGAVKKLHGFYCLSAYVYLLQGLFSGASARLLFASSPKLYVLFGWILAPTLIVFLYFRLTSSLKKR